MVFDLVEKKERYRLHASFGSREEAERFLRDDVPGYVTRNLYCIGRGLRAEDFEIIESK